MVERSQILDQSNSNRVPIVLPESAERKSKRDPFSNNFTMSTKRSALWFPTWRQHWIAAQHFMSQWLFRNSAGTGPFNLFFFRNAEVDIESTNSAQHSFFITNSSIRRIRRIPKFRREIVSRKSSWFPTAVLSYLHRILSINDRAHELPIRAHDRQIMRTDYKSDLR